MRKFADKEHRTKNNQADGSKTEATLILCGYSGERANNRGDSTIKEEVRRRKMRKFADKQSSKQRTIKRFKHGGHSNPLWILGERANKFIILTKETTFGWNLLKIGILISKSWFL